MIEGLKRLLGFTALVSTVCLGSMASAQALSPGAALPDMGWYYDTSWYTSSYVPLRTLCVDLRFGNDANDGSTACKRTIQAAVDMAQPGDDIFVVYRAQINPGRTRIPVERSGTPTRPIRLLPAGQAIIPVGTITVEAKYWVLESVSASCLQFGDPAPGSAVTGIYLVGASHVAIHKGGTYGCRASGIIIRGSEDVLIDEMTHANHHQTHVDGYSWDSHGIDIEPGVRKVNGVDVPVPSQRIHIRNNKVNSTSGDGVQCQGGEAVNPAIYDSRASSRDITIEGNEFYDNGENAVDIKSCEGVSIIGNNRFYDIDGSGDNNPNNGGSCGGSAVLLHYSAKRVLIEGAEIRQSGVGIEIGNEWQGPVSDVVIRRNRIHSLDQERWSNPAPNGGTVNRVNCGDGVRVNRAQRVDIHQNTFHAIPHSALRIGVEPFYALPGNTNGYTHTPGPAENVRAWNNVFSSVSRLPYLAAATGNAIAGTEGAYVEANASNAPGLALHDNSYYSGVDVSQVGFKRCSGLQPMSCAVQDFNTWSALTPETNSNVSATPSPMFISPPESNGFKLAPGSLAMDSALPDATNQPTACGAGPDRGAVESDCP